MASLQITVLGLSITSSWGNGHATTWRALLQALAARGHRITFLERDAPWYRAHRDLATASYCSIHLYRELGELKRRFAARVAEADVVILGSFVPNGVAVARWLQAIARGVTVFYDIDTPVTLARLARGDHEYLSPDVIPRFDLYLSFAGGPSLMRLERRFGAKRARPLYCAVDPEVYRPLALSEHFHLGYLGTYSADRQPILERLLVWPARVLSDRAFVVAGPQYPTGLAWPANVARLDHVPPGRHPEFYNRLRFTLNITRADMVEAGWSPSVRLFEAAACGIPIISDKWPGIDEFLVPGREILVARSTAEVMHYLCTLGADERARIAEAARARVLKEHTAACRAKQFERHLAEVGVQEWSNMAVSA